MSYTSKYTGNEIDELLDKVKNSNASKIVLWEGELTKEKESVTLAESVENFDFILIEAMSTAENDSAGIETRLVDASTIRYTGSTSKLIPSHNIYSNTGGGNTISYRIGFCFESATKFFIFNKVTQGSAWTNPRVTKITGISLNNLINDSTDSAPIGNIISFMGTKAPNGYLVCDGAELEISKYAKLAAHFEEQFGSKNHFGGDGTTTFAVPDLRNEFLRGYHGDKEEQLSGEIGIHQEATIHQREAIDRSSSNGALQMQSAETGSTNWSGQLHYETKVYSDTHKWHMLNFTSSGKDANSPYGYTSRPTNVAVLYCIKY